MKISNKSPAAVSNPSTFTITTTTHNNGMFNSASPHNTVTAQGAHGHRGAVGNQGKTAPIGSNPSSVKHNTTKQSVMSDVLLATEQSSIKQRENIKVFAFKPGNIKATKQINVASLKTSQISL